MFSPPPSGRRHIRPYRKDFLKFTKFSLKKPSIKTIEIVLKFPLTFHVNTEVWSGKIKNHTFYL